MPEVFSLKIIFIVKRVLLLAAIIIVLPGCITHRYYVNPFNGNHSAYHPIPLKSDSIKSTYYAAAAIAIGSANDQGADDFFAFHSSLSGAHNIGSFQAFYSLNAAAGNYKVDSAGYIQNTRNKYFNGVGLEAGVNVVMPFDGGEWRIIGIESALWNEGGRYLQFRKALPGEQAELVIKDRLFGTFGGYSEFIANIDPITLGMRIGAGSVVNRNYFVPEWYEYSRPKYKYKYAYFMMHLSRNRYTGYIKCNFATKADAAFFGFNYRIGR